MAATVDRDALVRQAVTFQPAGVAGPQSQMVFSDPKILLSASAVRLPVDEALPVLMHARRHPEAHATTAAWGAAAMLALKLVARGRLRDPDPSEVTQARSVAASLPYDAAHAGELVHGFFHALADTMPESASVVPSPRRDPPRPRPAMATRLAARSQTGVRLSLRVEFGSDPLTHEPFATAVVCVHDSGPGGRVADAADLWTSDDHGFGASARIDVISAITRSAHVWPPLDRLRGQITTGRVRLEGEELQSLRAGPVPGRLQSVGIVVHWPRRLRDTLTSQPVVVRSEVPGAARESMLGGDHAFAFDWRLALGDDVLSADELDQLTRSKGGIVHLRDQWFVVDPEVVARARTDTATPIKPLEAVRAALTGSLTVDGEAVELAAGGPLDDLRHRLTGTDDEVAQPAALHATLRDYQLRGLRWLVRMTGLGLGGCLADDMGLGKTIMVIALQLHRRDLAGLEGPTLVVCPASVLGNWEREIKRFAPDVAVRRFHGATRSLEGAESGYVLTTYGTMRSDAERLAAHTPGWSLVVADEAQQVKNPLAGTARALRTIPARARVALTGTPVENNLSELWAILDWTTPGLLGDLSTFRLRWARPIEAKGDREVAARLSQLVRPFLLRRRKSDPGIAPELPPKTETDHRVSLTREQVGLYAAVVRETLDQIAISEGMRRRGLIVKLLTACKQICNHPGQYLPETADKLTGRSGKLSRFDELIETIVAEDGAVLVFTQYVAMGRLLERHLRDQGIEPLFLHGGTPVRQRDEMVERFQSGAVPVFLLSLKAAGTGLNLTRADHVIHYDRWWNPAVEDQATDRAYRIGQTKAVQVHRLVAEGTVEDRIADLLTTKRALADAVVNGGETALTELSDSAIADLVALH